MVLRKPTGVPSRSPSPASLTAQALGPWRTLFSTSFIIRPKRQIVDGGNLAWAPAAPSTDLRSDLVLTYVRRVRNNLFHGGKFNGRWFQPQRSEQLLKHSLTILHACLAASKNVNDAFHG